MSYGDNPKGDFEHKIQAEWKHVINEDPKHNGGVTTAGVEDCPSSGGAGTASGDGTTCFKAVEGGEEAAVVDCAVCTKNN